MFANFTRSPWDEALYHRQDDGDLEMHKAQEIFREKGPQNLHALLR